MLIDRWSVFEALITELKAETARNGSNLAFVLIPNKEQVHQRFRTQKIIEFADIYSDLETVTWDLAHEPNQTMANFLESQGVPVLDLLPIFQAHDQEDKYDLYYEIDKHLNREGHYLTSQLVCDWLIETELVPQ